MNFERNIEIEDIIFKDFFKGFSDNIILNKSVKVLNFRGHKIMDNLAAFDGGMDRDIYW